MRRQNLAFPVANGTALAATDWTTQTIANGGGAGADTFSVQSNQAQMALSAASNSKQHVKYTNAQGNHSDLWYRGSINWSGTAADVTNFMVRSTNVVVADSNFHTQCYVFEFDITVGTVAAYQVTASTPAAISGAPAASSFTYTPGTTYLVDFLLRGSFLGVKIWAAGTNEPGQYNFSVTDPTPAIARNVVGGFTWANQHIPVSTATISIGPAVFLSSLAQRPSRVDVFMDTLMEDALVGRRPVFRRF